MKSSLKSGTLHLKEGSYLNPSLYIYICVCVRVCVCVCVCVCTHTYIALEGTTVYYM